MFKAAVLTAAFLAFTMAPVSADTGETFTVDDFNGKQMFNLLGGKTQGYEEAGVKCIPTFTEDPAERHGETGASLRLDFDVSKGKGFSYYWSTLLSDLRGYDFLSFWYRDPAGGVLFAIEVHQDVDADGSYIMAVDKISSVDVAPYLDSLAAGKWQKIEIPLTKFSNIDDWSRVLDIVFLFRNGRGLNKGTVFIDDLSFVKYIGR
ncbi:MAG: hypothetical protein WC324_00640 [Candidatus Omnitrophota bacterium]|jgi:hypothetical protein